MGATVVVWVGDGAIDGDGSAEDMVDFVEELAGSVELEALAGFMAEEPPTAALAAVTVVGAVTAGAAIVKS
jgi:hypothetical protein